MTALKPSAETRVELGFPATLDLLGDGQQIEIRPLRPSDLPALMAALARVSDESMRRRFFGLRRVFSPAEVAFFTSVDFANHVALVAVADNDGNPEIAGGARYVVARPRVAELAFCVVDDWQHQGIGTALMSQLIAIARRAGLRKLIAEVLPENQSMLRLCQSAGPHMTTRREAGVVHVSLDL